MPVTITKPIGVKVNVDAFAARAALTVTYYESDGLLEVSAGDVVLVSVENTPSDPRSVDLALRRAMREVAHELYVEDGEADGR